MKNKLTFIILTSLTLSATAALADASWTAIAVVLKELSSNEQWLKVAKEQEDAIGGFEKKIEMAKTEMGNLGCEAEDSHETYPAARCSQLFRAIDDARSSTLDLSFRLANVRIEMVDNRIRTLAGEPDVTLSKAQLLETAIAKLERDFKAMGKESSGKFGLQRLKSMKTMLDKIIQPLRPVRPVIQNKYLPKE